MITFTSKDDLSKLSPDDPVYPIVEDLVRCLITDYIAEGYDYNPEGDGWIAIVEESDKDRVLTEIWPDWTLLDIPWEAVSLRDGYFIALFLANNQFGVELIFEDAPWVNGELRQVLIDNLDHLSQPST